ncbi:MAG: MFS transporter [Pseudomonadota bacterium]|nr:MFS transporter [Pseudomonadota bacterium]
MSAKVPYWRLSAFYFSYFGLLGAMLPFWGLYLQQQGFSLVEIGQLMAILVGTKLVAPNIWGWLADHTGKRMRIIRVGALLALMIFGFMFQEPAFWGMAAVMAGFSFFWNAILPQFEVVTLRHLKTATDQYSRIRLWGSVGFVVAVVGLGWFFERASLQWLPLILLFLLAMIVLASFSVGSPPGKKGHKGSLEAFMRELKAPQPILFFSICFLLQISHGPYYTFFSIYLEDYGYSKTLIGWLWALGVIAEIVIFLIAHRLFDRFSVRSLACTCLALAALRWLVTGLYPQSLVIILLAQITHAATFGVFHAIAMHLIHRYFSSSASGQGQAMYSALSFGAGGAIGAFLSGFIVENWGGSMAYFMAAGVAIVAAVLALSLSTHPSYRVSHDGTQSA